MAGLLGSQPQYGLLGQGPMPGLLGQPQPWEQVTHVPQPTEGYPMWNYMLNDSFPAQIAKQAYGAVTLPGDVYAGRVDPNSDEAIGRAADFADFFATGGIASAGLRTPGVGIFGGKLAKTADHAALAKAEKMAAQGVDRGAIWSDTGWFQGVDGKWRFEIPDDGARYSNVYLGDRRIGEQSFKDGPMEVAVEHPDLYAAYPDIRDANVVEYPFANPDGVFGQYREGATFSYSKPMPETVTLWKHGANKGTALHETQHALQAREGFARGGNPRGWAQEDLPDNPRFDKWHDNQAEVRWANEYHESPEYKADLDAQNKYYTEVWQPRLDAEEFAGENYERLWDEATADIAERFPRMARLDKAARDFGLNEPSRKIAPQDAYRRLAGETEARNVQTRMDMTPEQRRATPPWETQDVPDADQIVRFGGEGPQASIDGKGVVISRDPRDSRSWEAFIDGQKVASASMTKAGEAGPYVDLVRVDPRFQRQGIATQLYDQIESDIGKPLIPSPTGLSPEATKFWKNRLAGLSDAERQDVLRRAVEIGDEKKIGKSTRERLKPLGYDDGSDFRAYMDNIARKESALKTDILGAVESDGAYIARNGDRTVIITRSARDPEMLQVTNFNKGVPTGHLETQASGEYLWRDSMVAGDGWAKLTGADADAALSANQPLARNVTKVGRTGRPIETQPFSTRGDAAIMDAAIAKASPNIPMAPSGIKAYHGSPHDFDKFSMDKIGTGEGAQAYGRGLYFAENPETATAYREQLTRGDGGWVKTVTSYDVAGRHIPESSPDWTAADVANSMREYGLDPATPDGARWLDSEVGAKYMSGATSDPEALRAKAMEFFKSGDIKKDRAAGRTYEVSINAHPDDFLDWDKPLSEQPKKVRDVFAEVRPSESARREAALELYGTDNPWMVQDPEAVARVEEAARAKMTGQDAMWSGKRAPKPGEVEAKLRKAGIKGIRYKDAGSRGADGGTSNYVVFDQEIISILKKYGVPGLIAAGMGKEMAEGIAAQHGLEGEVY